MRSRSPARLRPILLQRRCSGRRGRHCLVLRETQKQRNTDRLLLEVSSAMLGQTQSVRAQAKRSRSSYFLRMRDWNSEGSFEQTGSLILMLSGFLGAKSYRQSWVLLASAFETQMRCRCPHASKHIETRQSIQRNRQESYSTWKAPKCCRESPPPSSTAGPPG